MVEFGCHFFCVYCRFIVETDTLVVRLDGLVTQAFNGIPKFLRTWITGGEMFIPLIESVIFDVGIDLSVEFRDSVVDWIIGSKGISFIY